VALKFDDHLRTSVSGETVSTVVTKFLLGKYEYLTDNGRSDYPDVFINDLDYTSLPKFSTKVKVYGAALKGQTKRPVRVPDGLEIKTCRKTLRVDCHYNHMGLHLALIFQTERGRYQVTDLAVAFLNPSDYHASSESTEATTRKFSFNDKQFVSLMR